MKFKSQRVKIKEIGNEGDEIMKFRRMEEMTKNEIEHILQIVCPYSELLYYDKEKNMNFIKVYYRQPYDKSDEVHCVELLPDEVVLEDGENVIGDKLYEYEMFTIAKGYSEYWLGNPYLL